MSEKIKELALKNVQHLDWDPPSEPKEYTFTSDGLDQFAQSIVQEVFSKLEDKGFEVYEPVIKTVKQHFGVAEDVRTPR